MHSRFRDDPVLAELKKGLRAGGPDFAAPPSEARAQFEQTLATIPAPEDITFSDAQLGERPVVIGRHPGADETAALLYLHGGAFVAGSAQGYRVLAGELGRATGVPVYALEYRLAPEAPFPAAIEDCCAAYRALLNKGLPPERIVLAGDSAGGGLVVSMLLALRDAGDPMPAGALAISPWADLTCMRESITAKAAEDASLTEAGLRAAASHYLGNGNPHDPLASPVFADLTGLPPLLIQVGSAEILLDDSLALARAAGYAGVAVQLQIWPDMPHVWHAFGFMLEAGRAACTQAGDALRAMLDNA